MKLSRFLWGLPILIILLIFGLARGQNEALKIQYLYPEDSRMWEMLFNAPEAFEFEQAPLGVIMPHHLAVGEHISRFYQGMAEWKNPQTVYVVSPNHYDEGQAYIQTCGECVFGTAEGDLFLDIEVIERLNVATVRDETFVKEHGIFAHSPFIKHFFPEAKIVPILLRSDISEEDIVLLSEWLDDNLRDEDLLIASIDFSHYKTIEEADKDDALTNVAIVNFDTKTLYDLYRGDDEPTPIDSPATANLILNLMEKRGYTEAVRLAKTNTQQFFETILEETTSHQFFTFYLPQILEK
jgi:MEMO1 family protein